MFAVLASSRWKEQLVKDKENKTNEEQVKEVGMFNFQKKRADLVALWNSSGNHLTLVLSPFYPAVGEERMESSWSQGSLCLSLRDIPSGNFFQSLAITGQDGVAVGIPGGI